MAWHTRRDTQEQPGPPKGGIPKQKVPRWLRFLLRLCVYPFVILDLTVQRLIRAIHRPPFRVAGACKKRGNCCHYILLGWHPVMDKFPKVGRFWLWWYTHVHGFYLRGFDIENENGDIAKVMSCRYLQKDGSCGSYLLRPGICRRWPNVDYVSHPYMLKGCGYFAAANYPMFEEDLEKRPNKTHSQSEAEEHSKPSSTKAITNTEELHSAIQEITKSPKNEEERT